MLSSAKLVLLSSLFLAGCASHQVTQQAVAPEPVTPFNALQVQVDFATPAQSEYLANQLVSQLRHYGVRASLVTDEVSDRASFADTALLQVTLNDSWTETFISRVTKHRRSLTQMRGRVPRESPRFSSEILLQDLATGKTIWQLKIVTAGSWYSDFNTIARSLAVRITRQLKQKGLIGTESVPAAKPTAS